MSNSEAEVNVGLWGQSLGKGQFVIRTHGSLREIGRERWQTLVARPVPPHLSFEWLDALEVSGSVKAELGWMPLHFTVEQNGVLIAAAPAYLRGDSRGEFVFDQSWAAFAERRLGLSYYPKLVLAVPFTPATGPRVLVAPGVAEAEAIAALDAGVRQVVDRLSISGAHVLFPTAEQSALFVQQGWQERHSIQFHWNNTGYRTFDDFLGEFTSKRRHQIRRERRLLAEGGIRIEVLTGSSLTPEIAGVAYELYLTTVDKFVFGQRYLNRRFFELIFATLPEQLMFVAARDDENRIVAGALNLVGGDAMFGRYWGSHVDVPFLHFECCYYRGIEEAIARGLSRFEPGAGGEHKLSRGFMPTAVRSCHRFRERRLAEPIAEFLEAERVAVRRHLLVASGHAGFKAEV